MQFMINSSVKSLILILFIGFITGDIHNVCEICSCDTPDKPIIVNCTSKQLTNLSNITFSSTIETLLLMNNSLTFQSVDDITKINNLTSLKTLVLSNNPLMTIPELSLSQLVNLRLKNISLKTIQFPKSYENSTNLQMLSLSNNKLFNLTSDNFKSLTKLTNISIDNAQLNSIEQNTFLSLSQTLQSISLVSNSLKSTEFLSPMTNLLSINFDQNKFKQLPTEIIKPGRIKQLFFRNNQIDIINEYSPIFYWTKTNLTDIEIYLNNNPFDCCQSRWFINYLTNQKHFVKDSLNLTCALPKIYAGKRLIDLQSNSMDCSTEPFHPSNIHLRQLVLILLCLIGVVSFILVVVGGTLYRRNKKRDVRYRRDYEQVQGDNTTA